MTIVPHEDFVFPPPKAFLIMPRFVASDLWVWPLLAIVAFFWVRSYHRAAGLKGREIDLLVGLRTLNFLFLWGTVIALGRAVHRATDDLLVSGLWTGIVLTLTTGGLRLFVKHSAMAAVERRAREAIESWRQKVREQDKARKEAKRRGERPPVFDNPAFPSPKPYVNHHSPAAAKEAVAVLMRKDLFVDPPLRPVADTTPERPVGGKPQC